MSILKRIFGAFILLIGLGLLGWIAYNFFIEMQPEARERSPLPALVFAAGAIYIGVRWLFAKRKTSNQALQPTADRRGDQL
jgi:uncharacterized membrane-anchored protein